MHYIAHRINTINQLKQLDKKYGIEIDIRDNGKNLVVVHDPLKKGILLKSFLKFYKHRILIANIKSERIEDEVIKLFKKNNWPIIDVTRRSVEETAASILKIIEIKRNK